MKKNSISKLLPVINFVSIIAVIVVNFLANYLPLNDKTTEYLSDQYPNLFVPAGITFAIWGVIYLLLLVFAFTQLKNFFKQEEVLGQKEVGFLFAFSCVCNILWVFAWHYQQVFLSLIFTVLILISLIKIYLNLEIGQKEFPPARKKFVNLPFSVYLGWITVATIANFTAFLVDINWGQWGFSEVFWTIVMIIIAVMIYLYNLLLRRDLAFTAVLIWTLIGIIIKRSGAETEVYWSIIAVSILGIILLLSTAFKVTALEEGKNEKSS